VLLSYFLYSFLDILQIYVSVSPNKSSLVRSMQVNPRDETVSLSR